jgi:hypothetical protein
MLRISLWLRFVWQGLQLRSRYFYRGRGRICPRGSLIDQFSYRRNQSIGVRLLHYFSDPVPFCFTLNLWRIVKRVQHNRDSGLHFGDFLRCHQSVHDRHCEIQDDYVRVHFISPGERFLPVCGFAAHFPFRIGAKQCPNLADRGFMVISNQYSGRHSRNPSFRVRPNPNLSNTVKTVRYRTFR